MSEARIDVIHCFDSNTPSVKNLIQGLKAVERPWEIYVHKISKPDLPTEYKLSTGLELTIASINLIKKSINIRRNKTDILIIHKTLYTSPFDKLFNLNINEFLFTHFNPEYNIVYSTYDADYATSPKPIHLFRHADLVYATSKAIEQQAQKYTQKNRVEYIPPSVDTNFFKPNIATSDDSNSKIVLGWIGNIESHKKDVEMLVEILKKFNNESMMLRLLIGGGELPVDLGRGIKKLGIEVDIIDYVEWEEVPRVINSFDIGLAPLRDTEFNRGRSSEKVREYMACGIPVVASDVGENPYLISEDTGILVDCKNGWRTAITELVTDVEKRSDMGESARKHVCKNFSTYSIGEKIQLALDELLHCGE